MDRSESGFDVTHAMLSGISRASSVGYIDSMQLVAERKGWRFGSSSKMSTEIALVPCG